MISKDVNDMITRVGQGTPMGDTLRRYWIPALMSFEIPDPDCPPARVKLLGEELVAFRDTEGRIGLIDEFCAHRLASLWLGRNEDCGLRCVYHGWKYDVTGQCTEIPSEDEDSEYFKSIKLANLEKIPDHAKWITEPLLKKIIDLSYRGLFCAAGAPDFEPFPE